MSEYALLSRPQRQRASYRYRSEKLEIIWYTSIPKTDDEAFEYASMLIGWGFPTPRYIEYLDFHDHEYRALGEIEYDEGD